MNTVAACTFCGKTAGTNPECAFCQTAAAKMKSSADIPPDASKPCTPLSDKKETDNH